MSANVPSTVVRVSAASTFAVGILTAVAEVLKATTSILRDHLTKLVEALDKLGTTERWVALAVILVLCAFAWYKTRPKPSRLLLPEKFDIDPDNPRHLKGRDGTVADLARCCREVRLVELTGESGSFAAGLGCRHIASFCDYSHNPEQATINPATNPNPQTCAPIPSTAVPEKMPAPSGK